jgi:hypothetical protein
MAGRTSPAKIINFAEDRAKTGSAQAEANRANSERFMQGFLGNLRIEPLEKGITPEGDG